LCRRSCSIPAALRREVDTTNQSWLLLPNTQGPKWQATLGPTISLVSLSQTCCFHQRHTCVSSAFCASKAVQRNLCWLTCCIQEDRRKNTELRLALVSRTCTSCCSEYLTETLGRQQRSTICYYAAPLVTLRPKSKSPLSVPV